MHNVNAISPSSRLALLLVVGSTLGLSSGVAASQLDSLLANSPFGSVKSGQTVTNENQSFEFRTVSEENGQLFFSIYDATTKRSRWVTLNDTSSDLVVKNYDAEARTISLEQGGHVLALTLKSGPRVAQSQVPPMPSGMPPGVNGLPGQQMMSNGAKGPEAQRLQQIAEEIRRRRALRQQAPQMPMPNPNMVPNSNGPNPIPGSVPVPGANPALDPNSGPIPIYPAKP